MLNNLSRNRKPKEEMHRNSVSVVAEKKADRSSPFDPLRDLDMTVRLLHFFACYFWNLLCVLFNFQPSKRSNDEEVVEGNFFNCFVQLQRFFMIWTSCSFSLYSFRPADRLLQRWSSVRRAGKLNSIRRIEFNSTSSKTSSLWSSEWPHATWITCRTGRQERPGGWKQERVSWWELEQHRQWWLVAQVRSSFWILPCIDVLLNLLYLSNVYTYLDWSRCWRTALWRRHTCTQCSQR